MRSTLRVVAVLLGVAAAGAAWAHVPYLETKDFTPEAPFRPWSPRQSTAVYSWLESKGDVDWYAFTVPQEMPFLAEVLVPGLDAYAEFRPSFALLGPGLPAPTEALPVTLSPGSGALVLHDDGTKPRRSFFEPFGGKSYFKGPRLECTLGPGTYTLVCWDRSGRTGDYVAVIGKQEIWRLKDIWRALRVTPIIRRGGELHRPPDLGTNGR